MRVSGWNGWDVVEAGGRRRPASVCPVGACQCCKHGPSGQTRLISAEEQHRPQHQPREAGLHVRPVRTSRLWDSGLVGSRSAGISVAPGPGAKKAEFPPATATLHTEHTAEGKCCRPKILGGACSFLSSSLLKNFLQLHRACAQHPPLRPREEVEAQSIRARSPEGLTTARHVSLCSCRDACGVSCACRPQLQLQRAVAVPNPLPNSSQCNVLTISQQ